MSLKFENYQNNSYALSDYNENEMDHELEHEIEYKAYIAKNLCYLISTKHNIDLKLLKNYKTKLEEIEIQHKKLNSELIKSLPFRNTLTKYKIYDIQQEFIEALTNPSYLEKKLNSLDEIEFTPLSNADRGTLLLRTDEDQLKLDLLDLCNKLMNYKDYLLDKVSIKELNSLSFKSSYLDAIKEEIDSWNDDKKVLYKRIVLTHTGYKYDEFITTYELNYCNSFIRAKLNRITMPNDKIPVSLNYYKTLLDGVNHSNKMKTDINYKNYITNLAYFHRRISDWKQNLTIVSKNEFKPSYKPNAFSQNLLDYSHAFDVAVEDILDEKHKAYYMNNDIACRLNSYYRRLTFDIDVNNNSFNIAEFNQDIQFLFTLIFNKLSSHDIKVYFAVDISDRIDSNPIINSIKNNKNIHSPDLDIDVKYWICDMKKDVSIHVYVTGVYFTEDVLFGMSRRIAELVKSKHLFYIDPAPYHRSTQQFRAPYSGKLIADRQPILRNTIYTKEELIEFYKNCSPFPDKKTDEYASEFDSFYDLAMEKTSKGYRTSNKGKKVDKLTKDAKPIESKVDFDDSSFYDDVIIDKFNGEEILIDMMCQVINQTYGYMEHRKLRLIFINNMLSMGYNIATIRKFNESFGINHTDGSNTFNSQSSDDINFLQRESTYKFNESILYRDSKPITFTFKDEWRDILFRKVLSHSILKIIVKHIFVVIRGKQLYYLDNKYNYVAKRTEPYIEGPYENATQFGNYTLKLYSGEDIYKISPYDFITKNDYYYDYQSIGFYDTERNFNSFVYNTQMKKVHSDFNLLFNQVPELKILLEYITYNSECDKGETQNRIDYVLKSIAYAVQHPGDLKKQALIFITPQGSGKTKFFELLSDLFVGYVLTDRSLQMILDDQFRNYLMNKVIVCCEEIENNVNINKLKDFITQRETQINIKNRDAISVANTSLKLFATNNKQFDFITDQERRFVVLESDEFYRDDIEKPYSKLLDDQQYRNKCIDIIRDYLLSVDLKDFNFNTKKFIPKSCGETNKAIAENTAMKTNYDNLFIKCIFENCITPTKNKHKIMNYKHLIYMIELTLSNVKQSLHYEDLYEKHLIHYKNKDCYEALFDFITSHYDLNKDFKWNNTKIIKLLGNDQNFDIKSRPEKSTLNIPEIYDEFYPERPRVIKYLLSKD